MRFQTPLIEARLIRRYKRFLADMELADGRVVTAHCPNPGAMQGLAAPGAACWLEPNDDPRRKLGHGWRLVRADTAMVIVDTALANRIVGEALRAGRVPGLTGPVQAEVRLGAKSRMDFRVGDTFELNGTPVTVSGTRNILPNKTLALFPGTAKMTIHPAIEPGERTLDQLGELMAEARAAIESALPPELR